MINKKYEVGDVVQVWGHPINNNNITYLNEVGIIIEVKNETYKILFINDKNIIKWWDNTTIKWYYRNIVNELKEEFYYF